MVQGPETVKRVLSSSHDDQITQHLGKVTQISARKVNAASVGFVAPRRRQGSSPLDGLRIGLVLEIDGVAVQHHSSAHDDDHKQEKDNQVGHRDGLEPGKMAFKGEVMPRAANVLAGKRQAGLFFCKAFAQPALTGLTCPR